MSEFIEARKHYATVNDMIEILSKLSLDGYGNYLIDCNLEYWLARKTDTGQLDHNDKTVSFGGYCL